MARMMDYDVTLAHLGGRNKIEAMIGAKDFVRCDNNTALQFAIGKGARNGCNRVTIGLQHDHLYSITLWKLHRVTITELEVVSNVHAKNLRIRLSQMLEMDLSL